MEYLSSIDPILQLQGVLHNPMSLLIAFVNTLSIHNFYTESMIGVLGWFNYAYKTIVYSVYFLVFGYLLREIIAYKAKIFPQYVIFLLFLICSTSFTLPFLVMYLMWTPVAYSQILGVQGRYFLLLFPFVFLIIHQLCMYMGKKKIEMILMWLFIFFISLQSLIVVFLRYYKETTRENDLASYINYDPTKLDYLPINKQVSFGFEMKDEKKKITGFKFSFTTHNQKIEIPYRYKLMDTSCTNTYREGNLNTKKLQSDSLYEEDFPPLIVAEQNICFMLEPILFSPQDHYMSIIVYEHSPRIELLYTAK